MDHASPSSRQRVNIITHIHTDASSAETSVLNDRIGAAIRRCAGEKSPVSWAECFTPISRLEGLVQRGRGDHGPVHMILVTDHMRGRSHRLPSRHLAAAARTPRLALGAELATRTRDIDGRYQTGPEILAFGPPHLVEGPQGPYYGLSQRLIDELYDTCLDDDRQELCTRRARDLLLARGVAHALSHPLDGHALSLEGTLGIICEFAFIETINGGYSARSARMLEAFIRLNNALVAGAELPEAALTPLGRRVVAHILRHGRIVHALSGSDAHSHDFDRAVTAMPAPEGRLPEEVAPGDLFDRMLALTRRREGALPASPLVTLGRTATLRSLLSDVSAIILRNVRSNLRHTLNPITWANIAVTTLYITQDELRRQGRIQRRRVRQMERDFNPERLTPLLAAQPAAVAQGPRRIVQLRPRNRQARLAARG